MAIRENTLFSGTKWETKQYSFDIDVSDYMIACQNPCRSIYRIEYNISGSPVLQDVYISGLDDTGETAHDAVSEGINLPKGSGVMDYSDVGGVKKVRSQFQLHVPAGLSGTVVIKFRKYS